MEHVLLEEIKNKPDLPQYKMGSLPLLKKLKDGYLSAKTAVCIERAKHITDYMKSVQGQDEPALLSRAKAINHYMSNRVPTFHDDNLIAGSTTSKAMGGPVYPELMGISIWPELDTIGARKTNPQLLAKEDAEILNFDVFPFWIDRTLMEVTRKKLMDEKSPTLQALQLMEKIAFYGNGKITGISHTAPYYEGALHKGLNAMIDEAETRRKGADKERAIFYEAMQIAMRGIINYAKNLSKKAAELSEKETSEEKKKNFLEMSDILSRVPAKPATSFREAVNFLWLLHVGILAENVNMAMNPGRLDQILFPFFKMDIEQKKITIDEALTLIGCLWLKISDNTNLVPESAERLWGGAGSVPAVTLGGVDKDGKDAVNDLTYLMLKVTELLVIKDPNVNARYYHGVNSETYRNRVSQVIIDTKAIPAFYNDAVNIATLVNQGVSIEHARDYAVIGCVELASQGREYGSSSSILFNLSAVMDLTLYNGKRPYITEDQKIGPETGEPNELKSFEQFQNAFSIQLKNLMGMAIGVNEELGKMHQKFLPTPLLSCFFEGPMEKGKDLIFGGALYNSSGTTQIGFADVCDSLNAIEDAVYIRKMATLEQMVDAVKKNFVGYDTLWDYVKNKAPKYGMDDSDQEYSIAVKNSRWLVKTIYNIYQSYTNYRGGKYRPAFWTMTFHAGYGKIGKALPSGRKDYEVFSSGITPASQCAKDLTGAYLSVAKLGSEFIPGGVALNMKYTPEPSSTKMTDYLDRFTSMLEGYFNAGGMQVQYNIQTYETLLDAQKHPENYKELIVRVSGYSAYFNDLNEAMKHELITRTQYNLYTGGAVPYNYIDTEKGGN